MAAKLPSESHIASQIQNIMRDRPQATKPFEPEYVWGETPGGKPATRWEYDARDLWVQTLPVAGVALLLEKHRIELRGVEQGDTRWHHALPGHPDELAVDAKLVVLGEGQELRALDLASGKQVWQRRIGSKVSRLALDAERLYVVTEGPVFALNRATGESLWRAPGRTDPAVIPWPASASHPGVVILNDVQGEAIQAYEPAAGARLWEYTSEGEPVVAGPVADGVALISNHEKGAVAVDAQTGEELWRHHTGGVFEEPALVSPVPSPVPSSGGEQAIFTDGAVHALDLKTGKLRWERRLEDGEDAIFAIRLAGNLLLAESWKGRLLALALDTGKLRWEAHVGQLHGVQSDDKQIYARVNVPAPENRWAVLALDRATGNVAWELRARRMVPDLTLVGTTLLIELRSQALALAV